MARIGLRFSTGIKPVDILEKANPDKKGKLEYFRKKILDHLTKLENEERKAVNKAFSHMEAVLQKSFPVGTIRTWAGKKYKKMPDKKWKPVYEGHTRGAKMAISALKKKITAAKDEYEMMQIIFANRDRFEDKEGHPLPFVQELHNHIEEQKTAREPPKKQPKSKPQAKSKNSDMGKKTAGNDKQKEEQPAQRGTESQEPIKDIDGRTLVHNIHNISSGTMSVLIKEETGTNITDTNELGRVQYAFMDYATENHSKYKPNDWASAWIDFAAENDVKEIAGRKGTSEGNPVVAISFDEENKKENERILKRTNAEIAKRELSEGEKTPENPAIGPVKLVDDSGKPLNETDMNKEFEKIRDKYKKAKAVEGDEDEIQVGRETMPGKWKLVEADTPTASHDETTFHKTPGFPANTDGSTINDRDYGHDRAAQDAVMDIGSDFDGRALRVDNPVVVTTDGIVISGNNRTMSSKIAAKKGTDTKYIETLKKKAKKFGFTEAQVSEFKNPRVVFEVQQEGAYTTEQFAQFNQSGKKEMGPTEKAVKVSKLITPETVNNVAAKIGEFETLGELYADRGAVQHIFTAFKNSGLVGEFEIAKYIETGSITDDGKTFIETALLGSVMSENNIRGFNRPGCKSIRATLVRAITPLIENKSMEGYSITRELNEAADIAMQVAINRDKFKNVSEFSKQQSMFEKFDPVAIELAKKLEGTQKTFAEFMQNMNGSLKYAANGEADIFLGDVESKEDILGRFLPVKKAVTEVMNAIKGLFD